MLRYFFLYLIEVLVNALGKKVSQLPKKAVPLYKKVDMFDKLMLRNHWNEGVIMQHVIFHR